jgi:hypothetical protein
LAMGGDRVPRMDFAFPAALLLHAAMCSEGLRKAGGRLPFRAFLLATAYRLTRG